MKIEITTPISDEDRVLILALLGGAGSAEVGAPAAKKAVAPAPAKKAPAKKPEPVEEVVEAEIVEDVDTLRETAINKATKMVSDGQTAEVKAALQKAGARRVSELKDEDSLRTFLEALG